MEKEIPTSNLAECSAQASQFMFENLRTTTELAAGLVRASPKSKNDLDQKVKPTMYQFYVRQLRKLSVFKYVGAAAAAFSLVAVVSPGGASAQDKAAVLLPGSINDQSWNAQGYEGVKKLKAMGWDVAYTENVQAADMAQALQDYASKGYTLI